LVARFILFQRERGLKKALSINWKVKKFLDQSHNWFYIPGHIREKCLGIHSPNGLTQRLWACPEEVLPFSQFFC
jgi:hypothetical protein